MEEAAGKQALAKFSATERELKSGKWMAGLNRFADQIARRERS
jgi:hypothetical protein